MRVTDRGVVAALLVATLPLGCYKWEAVTGSPVEVINERSPKKVQVVLGRGSTVTLYPYVLQGDTLRGMERKSGATRDHVIVLSDVWGMKIRTLDGAATSRVILAGVAAASLIALAIAFQSFDLFEE